VESANQLRERNGALLRVHVEVLLKTCLTPPTLLEMGMFRQLSLCLTVSESCSLCQRHTPSSIEKPHPIDAPNKRPLSRKAASCEKYSGVLTSAFNHFANANSRKAIAPHTKHHVAYRPEVKFCGLRRHAAYAMASASIGPTTKNVSS
jgi:hypothetical protein